MLLKLCISLNRIENHCNRTAYQSEVPNIMQDFQRKKYFAKLYDVSYCKNLKGIRMWRWEQIRQKKKSLKFPIFFPQVIWLRCYLCFGPRVRRAMRALRKLETYFLHLETCMPSLQLKKLEGLEGTVSRRELSVFWLICTLRIYEVSECMSRYGHKGERNNNTIFRSTLA